MLQHHQYLAGPRRRWLRALLALSRLALAAVGPLLRLACRGVPPLGRALRQNVGGLQGSIRRHRHRGEHRAAYDLAQQGLARQLARARDGTWLRQVDAFHWWSFLDLAAQEADQLEEADRRQVSEQIEAALAPGGMLAASCLRRVAGWQWDAGDHDGAIRLARRAVLADPSWPHGHILLGWFGLISGRFDPLPHLRQALRADPSCAGAIRAVDDFAEAPALFHALGLTAGEPRPG